MPNYFTYKLDCGCIASHDTIVKFCGYHFENQPRLNDPLDIFLETEALCQNEKK